MQSKLLDLADNLSEINNKDCQNAEKEKKLDQSVNLLGLRITD